MPLYQYKRYHILDNTNINEQNVMAIKNHFKNLKNYIKVGKELLWSDNTNSTPETSRMLCKCGGKSIDIACYDQNK